ncbi:tRNA (adenosine(37)-N6)-threonylcarbamoyltransferase complex dimerization subunit type 1 TsaB [Paraburkholderia bonniea]|uniref:tRNA (adenosine(37)-N6)-threonylcarbamoyltransferase complex dimerization subunit type 1 TsaB n=1 Tax=Paraburkholderia bonniea TaxID=2152891 RepID=UPI0012924300|nr:tRNA (adenosine(37)-N6)-threonylcarbamoyltransferase complex dimerization subunit type 1 TsaB [Paraburkholderia bonniea]WJF89233.1 tRNA (adenosine(37)-N6)-threonylcarbamoyltransferase complex dimerization subunit type 1 TsaB [Paraburkholderia bonniea]WJF92549.1 tRNA (adenosine(37)-N6)-threonylcarbamoyltransferase complex dimerization subunit type 1 TsaB [Paraburkholderia bonniea]
MTETVLLALDTSTEFCSVALLSAASVPASVSSSASASAPSASSASSIISAAAPVRLWVRHEATGAVSSARLLPAIRELFDEAGLPLQACQAVAFGAGPGSFTGLRTATGVAQGLAFGLGCPVVPISTLMVCAESARLRDAAATRVLVALDARMDEVYWADYAWCSVSGEWLIRHAAALDAPDQLPLPDTPFTLAGNAAGVFGSRLSVAAQARQVDHAALPHAQPLALAALRAWRAGRTLPAAQAMPDYVRNKVAQTTAERTATKAGQALARDADERSAGRGEK